MTSAESSDAVCYTSTYRHGVDEKRRLQIPAKWRPADPEAEFSLMVWTNHPAGACLRVLPPKQMKRLMAEIDAMPGGDPNKPVLKRIIGGQSTQVALDKAGRICLPEDKARAAGIGSEAVLVGLLDRFEIWCPSRFAAVEAADNVMASMALKLME